ncbi:MAG: hypothetical protein SFW09_10625 [Hyphomicrobiaceae bacterium]|nr:hypothetical protein [Hyphomicrobiaceae bacterium]
MNSAIVVKLVALEFAVLVLAGPAAAQTTDGADAKLTARLEAEKEARKACKVDICKVLAEKKGDGAITCDVTKTWLQAEIQSRILGDRLTWPWGHAQCTTRIEIERSDLVKLVATSEATVKLKPHALSCVLDRKAPEVGEAYSVKLSVAPEITFKAGKATSVVAGWSNIEAPILAKGPIWAATATDNNLHVLSGAMVAEVNTFMFAHCDGVGVKITAPQ